jgi:hypothetical protein
MRLITMIAGAVILAVQPAYAYVDNCPSGRQEIEDGENTVARGFELWDRGYVYKDDSQEQTELQREARELVLKGAALQADGLGALWKRNCIGEADAWTIRARVAKLRRWAG